METAPITEVTNRDTHKEDRTDLKPTDNKSADKSVTKSQDQSVTTNEPATNENTDDTGKKDVTHAGTDSIPKDKVTGGVAEAGTLPDTDETTLGKRPAAGEPLQPDDADESEPPVEKKVKPDSLQKGVTDEEQPPVASDARDAS